VGTSAGDHAVAGNELDLYGNGQMTSDAHLAQTAGAEILAPVSRWFNRGVQRISRQRSPNKPLTFPDGTWKQVEEICGRQRLDEPRSIPRKNGESAERRSMSLPTAPVITTRWYRANASGWEFNSNETRPMKMLIGTPRLPATEADSINACP